MFSPSRSTRLGVAVVALALAGTACGGDDDDATAVDGSTTTMAEEATTTTAEPSASTEPAETVPDATAEDPDLQGQVDPGEGLGDELVLAASLTGDTEVPGPGDSGATGRIEIVSAVVGEWCIDMVAEGLSSEVGASHIHMGGAGESGDVVIDIGVPTSSDGDVDTWDDVCVAVDDAVADQVIVDPAGFYANIHTAEFGQGAIRGQLALSSLFDLELS